MQMSVDRNQNACRIYAGINSTKSAVEPSEIFGTKPTFIGRLEVRAMLGMVVTSEKSPLITHRSDSLDVSLSNRQKAKA